MGMGIHYVGKALQAAMAMAMAMAIARLPRASLTTMASGDVYVAMATWRHGAMAHGPGSTTRDPRPRRHDLRPMTNGPRYMARCPRALRGYLPLRTMREEEPAKRPPRSLPTRLYTIADRTAGEKDPGGGPTEHVHCLQPALR